MDKKSQKPPAQYNPGELDHTRKNLGSLDQNESARMMKVLGGKVGVEKYVIPTDTLPKKPASQRRYVQPESQSNSKAGKKKTASHKTNTSQQTSVAANPFAKKSTLPILSSREKTLFNRLMSSSEYRIKPTTHFLAFLFSFGKADNERLSDSFIQKELLVHIQHIDIFIEAMQNMILSTSGEYKDKITSEEDPHFKALCLIYKWETMPLKKQLVILKEKKPWATVEDIIPFIKELFKPLMQLYFLGESQMTSTIKQLYAKAVETNGTAKKQNLAYAKQAASEWLYIFGKIIKGLYPLFMRMILSQCEIYPDFYTQHIGKILQFLGITKYDLVLPQKQKKNAKNEKTSDATQISEDKATAEKDPQKQKERSISSKDTISQSLEILERLFPQAGWTNLAEIPDMYSYFHPLYQFDDGFNLISPANPLQVTIVLLRIIEDFFQACRNITFNIDKYPDYLLEQDSLQKIIAEWAQYREVIFFKTMNPDLREYVNHIYAQKDFKKSKYAKKQLSNWLWQMKYYFHPHLAFEIIFIERPSHDSTYKPLPQRIKQLVRLFSLLISTSNTEEGAKKANFNATYHFDVENSVSYRLDLLLGGKKSAARTNLNLMRYTLCALRALEWWINDQDSFAYREEIKIPYRTASDEGDPSFTVSLRSDQKDVFLRYAKKLTNAREKAQAASGASTEKSVTSDANTGSAAASTPEGSKSDSATVAEND